MPYCNPPDRSEEYRVRASEARTLAASTTNEKERQSCFRQPTHGSEWRPMKTRTIRHERSPARVRQQVGIGRTRSIKKPWANPRLFEVQSGDVLRRRLMLP